MADKIYTRTGDAGETGLFAGPRVSKDHVRIEAYGTVDELNAVLGMARAVGLPEKIDAVLERIQNDLFDLGAELATPDAAKHNLAIPASHAIELEHDIDELESALTPLKQFILPGGNPGAAWLHLARTVCRRAERRVVQFMRSPEASANSQAVIYLNRVSDLLFVMARWTNHQAGVADVSWRKR